VRVPTPPVSRSVTEKEENIDVPCFYRSSAIPGQVFGWPTIERGMCCRRSRSKDRRRMPPVMTASTPQAAAEILERIIEASSGLVLLDSADPPSLIAQFRAVARSTGQAMYLWQPDTGLGSLREMHVRVPDCQRLGNALRYMQQSIHFGIYFLVGLELPLSAMDATLLRQLARMPKEHVRRVVLIDAPAALAEHLGEFAVRLNSVDSTPKRLRLRDGRWLA
jgi:hypothetical protein